MSIPRVVRKESLWGRKKWGTEAKYTGTKDQTGSSPTYMSWLIRYNKVYLVLCHTVVQFCTIGLLFSFSSSQALLPYHPRYPQLKPSGKKLGPVVLYVLRTIELWAPMHWIQEHEYLCLISSFCMQIMYLDIIWVLPYKLGLQYIICMTMINRWCIICMSTTNCASYKKCTIPSFFLCIQPLYHILFFIAWWEMYYFI